MLVETTLSRQDLYQAQFNKRSIKSSEEVVSTSLMKLLSEELSRLYLEEKGACAM